MANIVFTTNPRNYSITNVVQEAECSSFEPKETLLPLPQKPKAKLNKKSSFHDSDRQDVYRRITDKIIADLEKGNLTCVKPWSVNPEISIKRPLRSDGTPYRGVNILVLWAAAAERGYKCLTWLTYNKAQELGGQVKRGEKGSFVVYANTVTKSDIDGQGQETIVKIPFYKGYTVFNAEQVHGLPSTFYVAPSVVEDEKNALKLSNNLLLKQKRLFAREAMKRPMTIFTIRSKCWNLNHFEIRLVIMQFLPMSLRIGRVTPHASTESLPLKTLESQLMQWKKL